LKRSVWQPNPGWHTQPLLDAATNKPGEIMKTCLKIIASILMAFTLTAAHAGIVEELLKIPAIQAFLNRQPELQSIIQQCGNPTYKQQNAKFCQQAEEASRLAKMPFELRAVLSDPRSAASIRELCLAVLDRPAKGSYMCVELAKVDSSFNLLVQQEQFRINTEDRTH
jgi:hypothetical protein